MAAPNYPAADVTPTEPASSGGGSAKRSGGRNPIGQLWRSKGGRVALAAGAALVLVVIGLARRTEDPENVAAPAIDPLTGLPLGEAPIDPIAGMGSGGFAQPIPDGGFDFQNVQPSPDTQWWAGEDTGSGSTAQPATTLNINVAGTDPAPSTSIVGGGGTATGSPGSSKPPAQRQPRGYYRTAKGAPVTFQDGRGNAAPAKLTPTQLQGIAAVEAKATRTRQGQSFVLGGISHRMHAGTKAFVPSAAAGAAPNPKPAAPAPSIPTPVAPQPVAPSPTAGSNPSVGSGTVSRNAQIRAAAVGWKVGNYVRSADGTSYQIVGGVTRNGRYLPLVRKPGGGTMIHPAWQELG